MSNLGNSIESVADCLQAARKFSKTKADTLAAETGRSRQSIYNYMEGRRVPDEVLAVWARITGFSKDALVDPRHAIWRHVRAFLDHQSWLKDKRDRLARIDGAVKKLESCLSCELIDDHEEESLDV